MTDANKTQATATTAKEEKKEAPIKLLNQLITEKYLSVEIASKATAEGLIDVTTWKLYNQSGRGKEKKAITINFCPITGYPLKDVDPKKLTSGQLAL